jgi:hypothetical protein
MIIIIVIIIIIIVSYYLVRLNFCWGSAEGGGGRDGGGRDGGGGGWRWWGKGSDTPSLDYLHPESNIHRENIKRYT